MSMGQLRGQNIVRYNISQNDGHKHWTDNTIDLHDRTHVYNNVFFNNTAEGIKVHADPNVTYTNNIFHAIVDHSYPANVLLDYNAFFGHGPAAGDRHAIVGDPQFVDPGSGGDGIGTVGATNSSRVRRSSAQARRSRHTAAATIGVTRSTTAIPISVRSSIRARCRRPLRFRPRRRRGWK